MSDGKYTPDFVSQDPDPDPPQQVVRRRRKQKPKGTALISDPPSEMGIEVGIIALLIDHPHLMATTEADAAFWMLRDARLQAMYSNARDGQATLVEQVNTSGLPAQAVGWVLSKSFANFSDPRAALVRLTDHLRLARARPSAEPKTSTVTQAPVVRAQCAMSPIEKRLIAELCERAGSNDIALADYTPWKASGAFEPTFGYLLVAPAETEPDPEVHGSGNKEWKLYSNVTVDDYKLDLILETQHAAVAVECDGHEWHERTKQQAAYDRARDRFFASQLLLTIRFTGSEIHHSASKCALEIFAVANAIEHQAAALARAGCSITGRRYRSDD